MFSYKKVITRRMMKANPKTLFVFGDNFRRQGMGGQAKEMRGEPNSIGIPTKLSPSYSEDAFFTDAHYEVWMTHAAKDILRLMLHEGDIMWPTDGIGTNRAELKTRSPKIWDAIKRVENMLISSHAHN